MLSKAKEQAAKTMNNSVNYDSASSISFILKERQLSMSKRFGQNFLISPSARKQIIAALDLDSLQTGGIVWEIGPGIGAMTSMLLEKAVKTTAFEIDHGFCSLLKDMFGGNDLFSLVEGDFFKTWESRYREFEQPARIMGNLPYNVGTIMIAALLEAQCLPGRMVFTLQKEVAQRITAIPGTKSYSAFSLLCSIDYSVQHLADLKPGNFYPRPDVVSSIVVFEKREQPLVCDEYRSIFIAIARDLFRTRRKTIKNNLLHGKSLSHLERKEIERILAESGVPENERGENLTLSQINQIARNAEKKLTG
jgi:16S rRNA (adenine1518-N6/adenine1519-N6)-dimethyltransferase